MSDVLTPELNFGHLDAYEVQTYAEGALVGGDALRLIAEVRVVLRENATLHAALARCVQALTEIRSVWEIDPADAVYEARMTANDALASPEVAALAAKGGTQ